MKSNGGRTGANKSVTMGGKTAKKVPTNKVKDGSAIKAPGKGKKK